jgi:hypothetical protein
MKKILRFWELRDFCGMYGRVTPHLTEANKFTSFHCEDRCHDASETIHCSEGIGVCEYTLFGILSMRGYVVQFASQDDMLLCTEEELKKLQEESKAVEEREREEAAKKELGRPENPARPRGVKITREIQNTEYKAYAICPNYKVKHNQFHFSPITRPRGYDIYNYVCTEDCLFPTCPFYSKWAVANYANNHFADYDDWIVEAYKNLKS